MRVGTWLGWVSLVIVCGLVGCQRPEGDSAQYESLKAELEQLRERPASSPAVDPQIQQLLARLDTFVAQRGGAAGSGGDPASAAELARSREQAKATEAALTRLTERYDAVLAKLADALAPKDDGDRIGKLDARVALLTDALTRERAARATAETALNANWAKLIEALDKTSLDLDSQKLREDVVTLRQQLDTRDKQLKDLGARLQVAQETLKTRDHRLQALEAEKIKRDSEIARLRQRLGDEPVPGPAAGGTTPAQGTPGRPTAPRAGSVPDGRVLTTKRSGRVINCIVAFPRGTAVQKGQRFNVFDPKGTKVAVFSIDARSERGGRADEVWFGGRLELMKPGITIQPNYRVTTLTRVPNRVAPNG